MQDADCEDRFLTIYYWTSRAVRDSFRERHAKEFAQLDRKCEAYTVDESLVGDFIFKQCFER